MSLLDALSGGLTTATNAATAQQQGQIQGNQLAVALLMRQVEAAKQQAETQQALANAARLRHQNMAPVLGEPGYAEAEGDVAGAKARAEVQPKVDTAVGIAQGKAPIEVDTAGKVAQAEVGPHVEQATKTFQAELPGRIEIAKQRALLSPMAQTQLSRLSQAAAQARDADTGMRAFEAKILSGQRAITPEGMTAARTMLKGGPLLSTAAEAYLNSSDPELAEYVRNTKAMGMVERMIMPRGGSNYMQQGEAALSGVGTSAGASLIHQAQKYRSRITQSLEREGTLGDAGISSSLPFPGTQSRNSGLGGFAGLPDRQ